MGERGKERREERIRRKEEGNCLSKGREENENYSTNEMVAGKEYGERDLEKEK